MNIHPLLPLPINVLLSALSDDDDDDDYDDHDFHYSLAKSRGKEGAVSVIRGPGIYSAPNIPLAPKSRKSAYFMFGDHIY